MWKYNLTLRKIICVNKSFDFLSSVVAFWTSKGPEAIIMIMWCVWVSSLNIGNLCVICDHRVAVNMKTSNNFMPRAAALYSILYTFFLTKKPHIFYSKNLKFNEERKKPLIYLKLKIFIHTNTFSICHIIYKKDKRRAYKYMGTPEYFNG